MSYLFFFRRRPFLRVIVVVLGERDVAEDIVVCMAILAWSEVPRLILGIVWVSLETLQFIIKGDHVESLLVSQGSVLKFIN